MTPIWMAMYAPITPSHIAAQDGRGWIVSSGSTSTTGSSSGSVYYYDTTLNSWVQETTLPSTSAFTDISASPDGSVVAIDGSGSVFLLSGTSWSQLFISTHAATNAVVGDVNNVAIVDSTGAITKSSYSINSSLSSGPTKITATAGLAQIWGVAGTTGTTVYKWNSSTSTWNGVSGKTLIQVHASTSSSSTTQIVGIDSTGKGWSGTAWSAIPVPNVGDKFAWLEAGSGYIWALLQSGAVYRGFI